MKHLTPRPTTANGWTFARLGSRAWLRTKALFTQPGELISSPGHALGEIGLNHPHLQQTGAPRWLWRGEGSQKAGLCSLTNTFPKSRQGGAGVGGQHRKSGLEESWSWEMSEKMVTILPRDEKSSWPFVDEEKENYWLFSLETQPGIFPFQFMNESQSYPSLHFDWKYFVGVFFNVPGTRE